MSKEGISTCFVVENSLLYPATIQNNLLIEIKKDHKRTSKSCKVFATLTKDASFSITKTEILENKKYKFSLQLKIKSKQPINLVIDGKQDLEFFIKGFSLYGMATGLQEMIVSCEKVGQGSFAQVYKVITNYDSVMALKAFEKKNLKIHKNKIAFQNEIDVMRMLSSRHIATVDGLFETEKNIYIKMEYFSFSLKHYIKKNISIKIQKRVMKQLLEALLEMKRKDIIHRDLKPENVMIRGKNQNTMECVVIDFGLATPASLEKYIFNRCGTPGFLAPEIAKMSTKKDKLTPACDMFSLGCIFYRILAKKYIFSAMNYNQVIEKNKSLEIPWDTFGQFSQNEKDLLQRMLEKDPLKRILPEQALRHPYFIQQIDDEDEIPLEGCDIQKKMKSISQVFSQSFCRRQSMESFMSSFHSSNNELTERDSMNSCVQKQKFEIKDSCLSFEGPVKGSDSGSRNIDLREQTVTKSRVKKRASRFSQVNQNVVL